MPRSITLGPGEARVCVEKTLRDIPAMIFRVQFGTGIGFEL
jgi:hypothetical protein